MSEARHPEKKPLVLERPVVVPGDEKYNDGFDRPEVPRAAKGTFTAGRDGTKRSRRYDNDQIARLRVIDGTPRVSSLTGLDAEFADELGRRFYRHPLKEGWYVMRLPSGRIPVSLEGAKEVKIRLDSDRVRVGKVVFVQSVGNAKGRKTRTVKVVFDE